MGPLSNRVVDYDTITDWLIDFEIFENGFGNIFCSESFVNEVFTMVSSDHRSCGRSLSEGSSGSLSGRTGFATDGSVVDEHVFVRRRTLSGTASCRAVTAPQAAAVAAPPQLGRRPRRAGSVV